MAYSESAYEASKKYKADKIKRIPLDVQMHDTDDKISYEKIRAAAERSGEKVNTYIKNAIMQRMEREGFMTHAGSYGISDGDSD